MPPGDVGIEVRTGKILLSGLPHIAWRASEGVQINQVQTRTVFVVHTGFHIRPNHVVPMWPNGGEGFCTNQFFVKNLGCASGLFHKKAINGLGAVRRGRPKLAHHDFGVAVIFESVKRTRVWPGRFGLDAYAIFSGAFRKNAVMVVRDAIAQGFAEVVEEAVAGFAVFDDFASQNRQIRQWVIAPAFFKFRLKSVRPVHAPGFKAVGLQVLEGFARAVADHAEEWFHVGIPIAVESLGTHVIDHRPLPLAAGSGYMGIGRRIPDSEHRPFARRRIPIQLAVLGISTDVQNLIERSIFFAWCSWNIGQQWAGFGYRPTYFFGCGFVGKISNGLPS